MNEQHRIQRHPILPVTPGKDVSFTFDGTPLTGREGEPVTSALFAAGIRTFGRHPKDGAPQGLFCANGQCSQCLVLVEGVPVKGCMTPLAQGMDVRSLASHPRLPEIAKPGDAPAPVEERAVDVLVIGGGPSGITGAIEIARQGYEVLLVDDKHRLGGKLVLQTHSFFGSVADCYAGTRGIDIASILEEELAETGVEVRLNTTAVGCFADGRIGVTSPGRYALIRPKAVLVATGAREKSIAFPGWDLPGVYGAGAFQTLVNRDRVSAARRIFVLGGGNVGLIAAYHAVQAGIEVAGLAEAMPAVGGYKVHQDKILRLGLPVFTSHTVARAEGDGRVERVVIARVDERFRPVEGTERVFDADTLLVAVGLDPVNELYVEARSFGMTARACGDAQEIAEASAAMFSGRIEGRRLVRDLGGEAGIPEAWVETLEVLKSKPGAVRKASSGEAGASVPGDPEVYPVIRCTQEIPCNPCVDACPKGSIRIPGEDIRNLPVWEGTCTGCGRCVAVCPGLAITLVDERKGTKGETAWVTVPFEMTKDAVGEGDRVICVDEDGAPLGTVPVVSVKDRRFQDRCLLVTLEVPWQQRRRVAGFRVQAEPGAGREGGDAAGGDPIICRCERVRKSEIVREIERGTRDMNQLKAALRCTMGACGGKTCTPLIRGIFKELGIDSVEVAEPTRRPFIAEVPMGLFAGGIGGEDEGNAE